MPSDNDWNPAIQPNPSRKGQEHVPFLGNFNRGRGATLNVTVMTTAAGEVGEAPPTTSIGLPVTRTITIKQAAVTDGIHHYEAIEDGEIRWSGIGDDPVDGLLQIVMRLTEDEDPPTD